MAVSRVASALVALGMIFNVAGTAGAESELLATYQGKQVSTAKISDYHCHDRDYPTIRCFATAAERDLDAETSPLGLADAGSESVQASSYVVWFQDINYGGASYMTSIAWSDLGSISWSNKISSFKSLNGLRPKWWDLVNYGTPSWQWAAGAQVSWVGDTANDRFSSVKNVP
jgi:hypothetical protein